jgi:hypothetical protein
LFTEKEQEKGNYTGKRRIKATILIQFHMVFTKCEGVTGKEKMQE